MHPLFARRPRLALFVLVCLIDGVLLAWVLRLFTPQPVAFAHLFAVPLSLVFGFGMLSAWWLCRAHPLGARRPGSALAAQLVAAAQAGALWAVLGAVWGVALSQIRGVPIERDIILRNAGALFVLGVPIYLLSAVLHYLFLAFEASHAAERRILESQVAAREAELRALRAQINPHFLFNSLNSINALVGTDPEGARRMCEGLGDFMRRTLTLGSRDSVTLSEELELVDRYLSIEQVRFGARLSVERELEPEAVRCLVPPLLLQPLVENAVKHGVAGRLDGGVIRLSATRRGGTLGIAVENPVDADARPVRGAGVGLANVRQRLAAFGTPAARLETSRESGNFRATLTLPAVDPGGELHRG